MARVHIPICSFQLKTIRSLAVVSGNLIRFWSLFVKISYFCIALPLPRIGVEFRSITKKAEIGVSGDMLLVFV